MAGKGKPGRKTKERVALDRTLAELPPAEMTRVANEMEEVIQAMVARMRAEVADFNLRDLPFAIGILTDKAANIKGQALGGAPHTQINIQVNGESRDGIVAQLLGKKPVAALQAMADVQQVQPKGKPGPKPRSAQHVGNIPQLEQGRSGNWVNTPNEGGDREVVTATSEPSESTPASDLARFLPRVKDSPDQVPSVKAALSDAIPLATITPHVVEASAPLVTPLVTPAPDSRTCVSSTGGEGVEKSAAAQNESIHPLP